MAAAKAGVATAQLTYDSKKELYAKNVVSQYDLLTAENTLLTAKAQLAQAEAQRVNAANNLSYTVVKAPWWERCRTVSARWSAHRFRSR